MKQLSSSRFRQTYLRETDPVEVTAYEKPIGYWYPYGTEPRDEPVATAPEEVPEVRFSIRPQKGPRPNMVGAAQRVLDPVDMQRQARTRDDEFQSRTWARKKA